MPNQAEQHRITLKDALHKVPTPEGKRFAMLFEHGTLQIEIYAPRGSDPQKPHSRDEAYIVAQGSGTFFNAGSRVPFGPGDFLFVPAHAEHRFEDSSDDFAVWVIFYGPEGGEKP